MIDINEFKANLTSNMWVRDDEDNYYNMSKVQRFAIKEVTE